MKHKRQVLHKTKRNPSPLQRGIAQQVRQNDLLKDRVFREDFTVSESFRKFLNFQNFAYGKIRPRPHGVPVSQVYALDRAIVEIIELSNLNPDWYLGNDCEEDSPAGQFIKVNAPMRKFLKNLI